MPRNLLAALFVSALLALILSIVPTVKWQTNGGEIATFQSTSPIVLNEQNLVDLFTLVPTHYNIKRVKWEQDTFYVDFVVSPGDHLELPLIYHDFYSLTYDLFQHTRNAKQIFFRMLEIEKKDAETSKLLVAIKAERPASNAELFDPDSIKDMKMFIEERYPVRIDPYFQERISP